MCVETRLEAPSQLTSSGGAEEERPRGWGGDCNARALRTRCPCRGGRTGSRPSKAAPLPPRNRRPSPISLLWKTACTWPGRAQLKDAIKIDRTQSGGLQIHYNSNRTINKAPKLNKSRTIMD